MKYHVEQLLLLSTGMGVTSCFQYNHHQNSLTLFKSSATSVPSTTRKYQRPKWRCNDRNRNCFQHCNRSSKRMQFPVSRTACLATQILEHTDFKLDLEQVKVNGAETKSSRTTTDTHAPSGSGKARGSTKRSRATITAVSTTITTGHHLSYQSALQVLRTYHSIHGNLVIPRRYVVPSDSSSSYPSEWHGLQIASTVYNMKWWIRHVQSKPERVYELNQLGFVWERLQPEYNLVLEALITYKALYGHVQVPASFHVPYDGSKDREGMVTSTLNGDENENEDVHHYPWPKATWGIPLGNCVHRIRSRGDFLRNEETAWSRRRQLDNLGFVWDISEAAFLKFFTAVKLYDELNLDCKKEKKHSVTGARARTTRRTRGRAIKVKSTFVVPSGEWLTNPNHHETQNETTTKTLTSTKTKTISHKMKNPWPRELWGYPLGARCSGVRQKGLYIKNHPQRQRALLEIGFQLDGGNATLGWLEVVHAAAIYSKMHGRVLDVPSNFVVPKPPRSSSEAYRMLLSAGADDVWPWPESLWGLQLGQRLKDVRLKSAYLTNKKTAGSRRAQLDALGFVWKPKRGRRKRSLGGDSIL